MFVQTGVNRSESLGGKTKRSIDGEPSDKRHIFIIQSTIDHAELLLKYKYSINVAITELSLISQI